MASVSAPWRTCTAKTACCRSTGKGRTPAEYKETCQALFLTEKSEKKKTGKWLLQKRVRLDASLLTQNSEIRLFKRSNYGHQI
jgi:hypothetical protein